jgi:L-asparagine oxygenase
MAEPDLAAAVRVAVNRWMQTSTPEQRQDEMANPATLSAALGLAVRQSLELGRHDPTGVRGRVLQVPFCHLESVFEAQSLMETPGEFHPVPNAAGTVAGRAAALAVHGLLHLETVSYGTENDGHLFVNLVAMSGTGAFAEKSKKSLRGHTDGVSFPFNGEDDADDARIAPAPDVVTLVGLRNPRNVPTKVMSVTDILGRLSPGDIDELKKPQYSIRSQKTFIQGMKRILGKEHVVVDGPVLRDVAAGTFVRYSHSTVIASTIGGRADQASDNFEAACNQVAKHVVVQPGDVLIINNRLSLHGRGEVGEEVGGLSRWLLRTYGLDTSCLPIYKRHLGGTPPHVLFP